jgi:polyphosphate kinase
MGIMSVSETGIVSGDSSVPGSSQHTDITDIAEIEEISDMEYRAGGAGPGTTQGEPVQGGAQLPADRYLDREQSWVLFNQRVLELAEDDQTPLLERVRFLAIFVSNLDEFFMVRVAGLMRRMAARLPLTIPSGLTPDELLKSTLTKSGELASRHAAVFADLIKPELARHDIEILRWKELTGGERAELAELFRNRIYPVLTPLVVDPAHPFPFISGLSLNLAVTLTDPVNGLTLFARVKVPPSLPRFLNVNRYRYVPIEDVIAAHLNLLFSGMDILEHYVFRVTRVRELEVDEDVTENLLQAMERELLKRRFEPAVRLEVEQDMSEDVLMRLARELGVDGNAVNRLPGPLDLTGLNAIADLPVAELRYPSFVPNAKAVPTDTSIFAALDERDFLVHHPYDSFTTSVQRLVEEAAADPRVLAIKQTLYRTSGQSPIVDALIELWWSRSRPGSTSGRTSPGPASSKRRAVTSSTALSE